MVLATPRTTLKPYCLFRFTKKYKDHPFQTERSFVNAFLLNVMHVSLVLSRGDPKVREPSGWGNMCLFLFLRFETSEL